MWEHARAALDAAALQGPACYGFPCFTPTAAFGDATSLAAGTLLGYAAYAALTLVAFADALVACLNAIGTVGTVPAIWGGGSWAPTLRVARSAQFLTTGTCQVRSCLWSAGDCPCWWRCGYGCFARPTKPKTSLVLPPVRQCTLNALILRIQNWWPPDSFLGRNKISGADALAPLLEAADRGPYVATIDCSLAFDHMHPRIVYDSLRRKGAPLIFPSLLENIWCHQQRFL